MAGTEALWSFFLLNKEKPKELHGKLEEVHENLKIMNEKSEELLFRHENLKHDLLVVKGRVRELQEESLAHKTIIDHSIVLVEASQNQVGLPFIQREENALF